MAAHTLFLELNKNKPLHARTHIMLMSNQTPPLLQTLHCSNCSDWLRLEYLPFEENREGVHVIFNRLPTLVCPTCSSRYLPFRSSQAVNYAIEEAKRRHASEVMMRTKHDKISKRYRYCNSVTFAYDWIDYEYLPGLERPWDKGFLTPVFFDGKVLLKYYHSPEYDVIFTSDTAGSIYHDRKHMIDFGLNRKRKLFTWLGLLDRLPKKEQQYFQSYNVKSDHDIASQFYENEIEANFTPVSKEAKLLQLKADFGANSLRKYGLRVYEPDTDTASQMKKIKRPIVWNKDGISSVINSLNQLCVESINAGGLKGALRDLDSSFDTKGLGGLKLLEHWIETRLYPLNSTQITLPFFVLYDLRVSLFHKISEERMKDMLKSYCKRLGLPSRQSSFERVYDSLIDKMSESYERLISHFVA